MTKLFVQNVEEIFINSSTESIEVSLDKLGALYRSAKKSFCKEISPLFNDLNLVGISWEMFFGERVEVDSKLLRESGCELLDSFCQLSIDIEKHSDAIKILALIESEQLLINHYPMFRSIKQGNSRMVEALIKYGANINFQDELGRTPLIFATSISSLEVVKVLLDYRADLLTLSKFGSALDLAMRKHVYDSNPVSLEIFDLIKDAFTVQSQQQDADASDASTHDSAKNTGEAAHHDVADFS